MLLPLVSAAAGCLQLLPSSKPKPARGRPNLQGWTIDIAPHYALGLVDRPFPLSKLLPLLNPRRPTRSVVLRFSLVDESAPLADDVDSDDEAVAHDGSLCLGRVTAPAAPRSTAGSCKWSQETSIKITITKATAQRCRSLAGLVLVIEAFGQVEGKTHNHHQQVLLATGRLSLLEFLRTQERRQPRSVLVVPLQPAAAGRAAAQKRYKIEMAISLACHQPLRSSTNDPAAGQGTDRSEPAGVAAAGGGQEQADEKVTAEAVSTEAQHPEETTVVAAVKHKNEPLPAPPSTPVPAAPTSAAAPPATPARIEALRQWQQWQREHQRQQLRPQWEAKPPKQQPTKAPRTAAGAAGAAEDDAGASASGRRAQLARMRSLLDELEGLPESLAEIRGGGGGNGGGAARSEGRTAQDKEKEKDGGVGRRVAVPRRAGTKRAAT